MLLLLLLLPSYVRTYLKPQKISVTNDQKDIFFVLDRRLIWHPVNCIFEARNERRHRRVGRTQKGKTILNTKGEKIDKNMHHHFK